MTNTHIETKSLALTTPVKILYLYKSLITCKQPLPPSTFCPGEGMQKECTPPNFPHWVKSDTERKTEPSMVPCTAGNKPGSL